MISIIEIKLVVFGLCLPPVIIAGFYLHMRKRYGYDIFEPYTFFCFPSLVLLLVNGLYTVYSGGIIGTRYFPSGAGEFIQTYIFAGIFYSICVFAFTAGYARPKKGWKRMQNAISIYRYWNKPKLIMICLLFSGIGVIAIFHFIDLLGIHFDTIASLSSKRSFLVFGGEFESSALGYHRWGAMLLRIVFLFAACFLFTNYRRIQLKHSVILIGLFGSGCFFLFLVSRRGAVVWFLLMFLVIRHYTKGPIKIPTLFRYVVIFLGIMLVMTAMREGVNEPRRILARLTFYDAIEAIGSRTNTGYANLTNIMLTVPELWDYQMGKTMVSWVVAPVPRRYWPQKPVIGLGEHIKINVYNKSRRMGGAVPTNSIGEFYINFGLLGMPLAMMWWHLGGIVTRKTYLSLKPLLSSNPTALILYCVILFNLFPTLFINSLSVSIINFLKFTVPIGIGLLFVSKRYSQA